MNNYLVTLELKTSWWKKILRFFKIIKQREEFKITLYTNCFKKGDILKEGVGGGNRLLILKKM
jgi:hypothetical protein